MPVNPNAKQNDNTVTSTKKDVKVNTVDTETDKSTLTQTSSTEVDNVDLTIDNIDYANLSLDDLKKLEGKLSEEEYSKLIEGLKAYKDYEIENYEKLDENVKEVYNELFSYIEKLVAEGKLSQSVSLLIQDIKKKPDIDYSYLDQGSNDKISDFIKENLGEKYGINTYSDLLKTIAMLDSQRDQIRECIKMTKNVRDSAYYDNLKYLEDYKNMQVYEPTEQDKIDIEKVLNFSGEAGVYDYNEYKKTHPDVSPLQFVSMIIEAHGSISDGSLTSAVGDGLVPDELEMIDSIKELFPDYYKNYEYLYQKDPSEAADYLKKIEYQLNQIEGQQMAEEFLEKLRSCDNEHEFLDELSNELGIAGEGIVDGVIQFGEGISNAFEGIATAIGLAEENRTMSSEEYKRMYILQALLSDEDKEKAGLIYKDENGEYQNAIENSIIDFTKGYYGNIKSQVYEVAQGIGNMLPSVALSMVNPTAGSIALGVSAGGNAYHQSMVNGDAMGAALMYGIFTGFSEAISEKALGGLPGLSDVNVTNLKTLLQAMGKEATQEMFQTLMDKAYRVGVMGEELPQTDEEWMDFLKDVGKQGLYGAITAGIMNASKLGVNGVAKYIIQNSGNTDANNTNTSPQTNIENNTNTEELIERVEDLEHGFQLNEGDFGEWYQHQIESGFFSPEQIQYFLETINNGYISPEVGNYLNNIVNDGNYDIYVKTIPGSDAQSIFDSGVYCNGNATSGVNVAPTSTADINIENTVHKVDGLYDLINYIKSASVGISQGGNSVDGAIVLKVPKGTDVNGMVYQMQDGTFAIKPEFVEGFVGVDENANISDMQYNSTQFVEGSSHNFDIIQSKYNYDGEVSTFLENVYSELSKYCGDERLVFDAFINNQIDTDATNVYEALIEKGFVNDSNGVIDADALKVAAGVATGDVQISYDENTNTYKIDDQRSTVIVKDFDINDPVKLETLIHEIGHAVYGQNGYEINGDILIEHMGLGDTYYKLEYKDGKVEKIYIGEEGQALEEAINTILEEEVTRSVTNNPEYNSKSYVLLKSFVQAMIGINPEIQEAFNEARVNHDKTKLREIFGSDYEYLNELTNRMLENHINAFKQSPEEYRTNTNNLVEEAQKIFAKYKQKYAIQIADAARMDNDNYYKMIREIQLDSTLSVEEKITKYKNAYDQINKEIMRLSMDPNVDASLIESKLAEKRNIENQRITSDLEMIDNNVSNDWAIHDLREVLGDKTSTDYEVISIASDKMRNVMYNTAPKTTIKVGGFETNFYGYDEASIKNISVILEQKLSMIPKELLLNLNEIDIVAYDDPGSAQLAYVYNWNGNHPAATYDSNVGKMSFFKNPKNIDVHVITHELGHALDTLIGNGSRWSESYWSDIIESDARGFVSDYASKTQLSTEDFAESLALYVTNPNKLKQNYPNRYSEIKTILKQVEIKYSDAIYGIDKKRMELLNKLSDRYTDALNNKGYVGGNDGDKKSK